MTLLLASVGMYVCSAMTSFDDESVLCCPSTLCHLYDRSGVVIILANLSKFGFETCLLLMLPSGFNLDTNPDTTFGCDDWMDPVLFLVCH